MHPWTCLTLNRLHTNLMFGHETSTPKNIFFVSTFNVSGTPGNNSSWGLKVFFHSKFGAFALKIMWKHATDPWSDCHLSEIIFFLKCFLWLRWNPRDIFFIRAYWDLRPRAEFLNDLTKNCNLCNFHLKKYIFSLFNFFMSDHHTSCSLFKVRRQLIGCINHDIEVVLCSELLMRLSYYIHIGYNNFFDSLGDLSKVWLWGVYSTPIP